MYTYLIFAILYVTQQLLHAGGLPGSEKAVCDSCLVQGGIWLENESGQD